MSHLSRTHLRKPLMNFVLCFCLVNSFLALLICLNYLNLLPNFHELTESRVAFLGIWLFLIISFVAQIAIIFLFSYFIVAVIAELLPRFSIVFSLAVLLGSLLIFALIADSIAFRMYHMHYAKLGWEVFRANAFSQVITFSLLENSWLIGIGLVLLLIESFIAGSVWYYVKNAPAGKWRYRFLIFFMLCIVASYSFNFAARNPVKNNLISNSNRYLMVKATRFVPYYNEIYELVMPANKKTLSIAMASGKLLTFNVPNKYSPLNYPKHVLQCSPSQRPLNIVFIVIDTWRYDAMNEKVTPTIYQFSKKSLQFQNHWSGGNCTKAGIFSLFYGLPENYWDALYQQQKSPVLIEKLLKEHYQMGIFASARLNFPAFHQTIFRDVRPLTIFTAGDSTIARDVNTTKHFQKFILANGQKPFFSFLFYDAAHNYCEAAVTQHRPFQPAVAACNRFNLTPYSDPVPYLNRYRNAVHFIDNEIKQVLFTLEQQHLLDKTIVIITADHGEELNDHHSGYWQHASAYTSYQLHTPLIVYWPGKKPSIYKHFTSHYDVVPTLMKKALYCKNPSADYSLGQSLFAPDARPILISGGYADYAILSKKQILRIYQGGDYSLDDLSGHPLTQFPANEQALNEAFAALNNFFY